MLTNIKTCIIITNIYAYLGLKSRLFNLCNPGLSGICPLKRCLCLCVYRSQFQVGQINCWKFRRQNQHNCFQYDFLLNCSVPLVLSTCSWFSSYTFCFHFGSGADRVSLLIVLLLLFFWDDLFKKPNAPSFQIGSEWNLAGLFLKQKHPDWCSRIFDMVSYVQDVSTTRCWAASAGLPPCDVRLWSMVHLYFVFSTRLVLVCLYITVCVFCMYEIVCPLCLPAITGAIFVQRECVYFCVSK